MRLYWHKIAHWEYWPNYVIYLPTLFLWVFYMFRFRSFTFFKDVNPTIKNGGLFGDSKKKIYDLLPADFYPKTILINRDKQYDFEQILIENNLSFPVISKPDVGYRGIMVEKINSIEELGNYAKTVDQDFLIQEICKYPNEIGLFYYRLPHSNKGKVSGITVKDFLTVIGNGKSTLRQLLQEKPRFAMQIQKLKSRYNLNEVLKTNEKICMVPYGNHNRGTAFYDGNHLITKKLEASFDAILKKIDGFYYGRLDIRFNTFEELEQGKAFSIIELNGVKSEPTHIYDPKHSFWYGQKEIFRHQRIIYKILTGIFKKSMSEF
ncbi:MAG: D-alanine--D-alanine ligase [Flavobacterium sp.]|nr:D-alanine--D-alanine ligase [Flavobacterium sp.]